MNHDWMVLIPAVLGLSLVTQFIPKISWISRYGFTEPATSTLSRRPPALGARTSTSGRAIRRSSAARSPSTGSRAPRRCGPRTGAGSRSEKRGGRVAGRPLGPEAGIPVVNCGDGRKPQAMSDADALKVLAERLAAILEVAEKCQVYLAIEPHGTFSVTAEGLQEDPGAVALEVAGNQLRYPQPDPQRHGGRGTEDGRRVADSRDEEERRTHARPQGPLGVLCR